MHEIIARPLSGGNYVKTSHPKWKYKTTDDFVIWVDMFIKDSVSFQTDSGYVIGEWRGNILTIFAGYMFDGASYWPDHELGMRGWIWHDFGYQVAQILERWEWDKGMFDIHGYDGYKLKGIVHAGVRLGGRGSYGKRDYVRMVKL